MWSCDEQQPETGARPSRRAMMLAVASSLAVLAGCADGSGFRPMYAQTGDGPRTDEKLASVDISPIPSRVGQRIRNEMIFQKTGGGAPDAAKYRLDIVIRESIGTTLVRTTGEAASQIYNLDASFQLVDLTSKTVVLKGSSYGRAGFDRSTNIYSNQRARDDAEARAARTIADDMRIRLSAFLSSKNT